MKDWFEWNGIRCTSYYIRVSEQPPLTVPQERAAFTDVPGRSGSLTTLEGEDVYDDMVLTAECFLANPAMIPAVAGWLRGSGKVTFANRPGGFYYARVVNQIPFEKILRGNPHRRFAVNFRCKPFWYASNVPSVTISQNGGTITNPGSVHSEPVITVYGAGDITLMVGQTILELTDISDSITLDSELLEAYQGLVPMNDHVSGEFPVLKPGLTSVSWTGNVTRVVIAPNWRYL